MDDDTKIAIEKLLKINYKLRYMLRFCMIFQLSFLVMNIITKVPVHRWNVGISTFVLLVGGIFNTYSINNLKSYLNE